MFILANAVVMTVTTQPPFNPSTDPQRAYTLYVPPLTLNPTFLTVGVSFVSIFIFAYHLTFWVFGAARSLSWDYEPGVPQGAAAERRVSWHEKPIGGFISRRLLKRMVPETHPLQEARHTEPEQTNDIERGPESTHDVKSVEESPKIDAKAGSARDEEPIQELSRVASHRSEATIRSRPTPTATQSKTSLPADVIPPSPQATTRADILKAALKRRAAPFANPIVISLLTSLIVALVPQLKALFVDATASGGPAWHGPDGRPPLAFAIDTANFIGAVSIPLSLILLGVSFARMRVPRPLTRLPIPAMLCATAAKMFVLPVFGILVVRAMTNGGMIPKEALAERFVAMFLSGTPAAVKCVIPTHGEMQS
jgi:auxin efflux carrier family protein